MGISAMKAVTLVVALTVGAIVAAVVLPVGISALVEDGETTATQDVGETVEVVGNVEGTLDSIDTGTATVTLNNTATGSSDTVSVDEGQNATATIDGESFTVTGETVNTDNATIAYEYPKTFGFSDGAESMWNVLDVMIVLGVFLTFIGLALRTLDRI